MNLTIKIYNISSPGSIRYTRAFLLLIFLLSLSGIALSQERSKLFVDEAIELSPVISEISGITFAGNKIYSINDSGNRNYVHILQAHTFDLLSSRRLRGSDNTDWEEITTYNNFLYIGDFGNNFGKRDDLIIYKISIDSLGKDGSKAEAIYFAYKNQRSFSHIEYKKHPWDCEAMLVDNSGIWLFSKDWEARICRLYKLEDNNKIDEQLITPVDSLKLDYLVTGAYFDRDKRRQFLCGYKGKHTYATIFMDVDRPTLSGKFETYIIDDLKNAQVESVIVKDNLMYLASERKGKKQSIYIIPLPESVQ